MPDVATNTTAVEVVENVRQTLAATTLGGVPIFDAVHVVDDVRSFVRVSDPLAGPKRADCGIVAGVVENRRGGPDEKSVHRLVVDVVVRFSKDRLPGSDEKAATNAAKQFVEYVRDAVMQDTSRDANASLVVWGGEIIDGTSVAGVPRMLPTLPNASFYAVSIPVVTVWSVLL